MESFISKIDSKFMETINSVFALNLKMKSSLFDFFSSLIPVIEKSSRSNLYLALYSGITEELRFIVNIINNSVLNIIFFIYVRIF